MNETKTIKINFADTGNNGIVEKFVFTTLDEMGYKYVVSNQPEYLFCGDFMTYQFLEYDCVKIFIGGENEFPNFNLYDYAIGEYEFSYDSRYLRWPFYLWRDGTKKAFIKALNKKSTPDGFNRKFCNMVVSNGDMSEGYRKELFLELSVYKKVDSAGRYLNNMGGYQIPKGTDKKLEFASKYKFSIACENASHSGYTTEKIIEAWNAGTVPIYWGNPNIGEEFNEQAFINCHAFSGVDEVVRRIAELDEDESAYYAMLEQPIISDSSGAKRFVSNDLLFGFLSSIFNMPYEKARKVTPFSRVGAINNEMNRITREAFYWNIYRSIVTNRDKLTKNVIESIQETGVYIYGAGVMGQTLAEVLMDNGVKVIAFLDRNKNARLNKNVSIPVYTIYDLVKSYVDAPIFISVFDPARRIKQDLESRGNVDVRELEDIF